MKDESPGPHRHEQGPADPERAGNDRTLTLRILATTDLHMQLLGHNDITDTTLPHHGLAGLASLIARARQEARDQGHALLLVDNGDLLQGSALADVLSRRKVGARHPLVAAFNYLRYDAVGLGNHDLDYGLEYLRAMASSLKMPVVGSNLRLADPGAILPHALVPCPLPGGTDLRVGILSIMPSQTAYWNCHRLGPADSIAPAVPSAADAVVKLRLAGADLVIALAHLGIRDDGTEDALGIAAIPGLDALVAGHTHRRFPGEAHCGTPGVDPCRGLLHGRPAIMPGHGASDLGALDLHLAQKPSGLWKVQGHKARLLRNTMAVSPNPRVQRFGAKDHLKVRASLETVVGHSTVPLHNFFSLARPTNTCALLASAQARVIKRALKGTPVGDLPLVAAAPAHTAGGREGPEHYLHLPPGPVLRRHLAGLAPFADEICALRIDGAGIRDWLEQSSSLYERLDPDRPDEPLIKAAEPRFNFDTLFGLSYGIDPGQVEGQRITHLLLDGQPVQRDQQFVMVTNQFRAGGGGGYRPWPVIHRSAVSLQHSVREELGQGTPLFPRDRPPWRFSTEKPLKALLATSTRALPYLEDIAHLSPEVRASEGDGFTTLALTLAPEW